MITREWATPLTIGAFAVMAVTGLLMFFHADIGLNKLAHEWLGWLMVVGALAHVVANWVAFKRHLLGSATGRAIVALCALVLAGSFVSLGVERGPSPPRLAMQVITGAPIEKVASLAGRPVEAVLDELAKADIRIADSKVSLEGALGKDRQRIGRALSIIFAKP